MNKLYNNNPKVNDRVEFILLTPDANKCYFENPCYIENITIYFIERNYASANIQEYDNQTSQANLEERYLVLKNIACNDPTDLNLKLANDALSAWQSSIVTSTFYYQNSLIVFQAGSATEPLWIRGQPNTDSIVESLPNAEFSYGRFRFYWNASGVREGDYFICYKWKPNCYGDTLSAHLPFYLISDIAAYTSNPTHRTPPEKYYDLLTRYLPEMYKSTYSDADRTPEILDKLNQALNLGFKNIEDLANQIIDLSDANVLQEPLLVYLANFFNLKLRSGDPTRWRKQIKKAIPLNKSKGTLRALREALNDAGINLDKFSQFWQVGTDYTFTESFIYLSENIFKLEKVSLPINSTDFSLEIASSYIDGDKILINEYVSANLNNIEIYTASGNSYMKYIGNPLAVNSKLKITYQIKEFDNNQEIQIHGYVISLPLADTRDDRYFEYPKKDWNTYVIEESDPLFDLIINVKNPFYDPVIFGKVRTEFPYSEQAYNMDEYNGSLRDSLHPKDIDKNFVEPCRNTISSRFSVELTIQDLSNIRLTEAQEIMTDYLPFHAILHTLQFNGYLQDYMLPANESWQILIKYDSTEFLIAGEVTNLFNRSISPYSDLYSPVLRNSLATANGVETGTTYAYNKNIVLFCPLQSLSGLGVNKTPSDTFLQILAPHVNNGEYTVQNANGHIVEVIGSISEPLNSTEFTFILSNIILADTQFNVYQDNLFSIFDEKINYLYYPIKTTYDVANGNAVAAWKVEIVSTSLIYNIANTYNNKLILTNDGTLDNTPVNGLQYKILDENNNVIVNSYTDADGNVYPLSGIYSVESRGIVVVDSATGVENIQNFFTSNNYFYFDSTGLQYYVDGYPLVQNEFYIKGYTGGDQINISGKVLQRVTSNTGNLNYEKMLIAKPLTFPSFTNPNDPDAVRDSTFKENYLIRIDSNNFYSIDSEVSIDSTDYLYISGKFEDWGTISSGGTSVSYDLIQYVEQEVTIEGPNNLSGSTFPFIDRSNNQLITHTTITASPFAMTGFVDESDIGNGPKSVSINKETIGYTIITKDNKKIEGTI